MVSHEVWKCRYKRYQLVGFDWSCPVSPPAPPVISPPFQMEIDDSEDDENPYERLKNEISIGRGSLKTAHINVNDILT